MKSVRDDLIQFSLHKLGIRVLERCVELGDDDILLRESVLRHALELTSYEYGGSAGFKRAERSAEVWSYKKQDEFLVKIVKKLPEYDECLQTCVSEYPDGRNIGGVVQAFCIAVAPIVRDGDKEARIEGLVRVASDDIAQATIEWTVRRLVHGLKLKEEQPIVLGDGSVIRRPTKEELQGYMENHRGPGPLPTGVTETTYPGVWGNEALARAEGLLRMLRIFRLGSIQYSDEWRHAESLTRSGGRGWREESLHPKVACELAPEDAADLTKLSEKAYEKVLKTVMPTKESYLTIAFDRFEASLLEKGSDEHQIAEGISCLEALYLQGKDQQLGRSLRQRASFVLAAFGLNGLLVHERLKKAYGIRSKYVHGATAKPSKRPSLGPLSLQVLEFCRASLCVFLQVGKKKEGLLSEIDDGLIDTDARKSLVRELRGKVFLPRTPDDE